MELRDYQKEITKVGSEILSSLKILYLGMEVRTGKTLTALSIAQNTGFKNILFITKKLSIKSIQHDYNIGSFSFYITIINNESLHTIDKNEKFDLIISDEHHRNSAYPKPNTSAKLIKERYGNLPMIFLSGTPTAESGSQWYHSFWVSNMSPFKQYKNFYAWAKDFTVPKIKYLGYAQVNDYSVSIDSKIHDIIDKYIITFTQKQAGFTSEISEQILYFNHSETQNKIIKQLLDTNICQGSKETILADTGAKLMSKIHQVSNGTIIFESGNSAIIDNSKALFLFEKFKGYKIALFYYYKKEYDLLKSVFGEILTDNLQEFDSTDKCIALQQSSGSEGISLKNAKYLVYYSFGFSGCKYIQGRDRLTTKEREENNVIFCFAEKSINEKVYNVIKNKKTYTEKLFTNDFRKKHSK